MTKRLKERLGRFYAWAASLFDAQDAAVLVFWLAIFLVGFGAEQISPGLGYLAAGLLILIYRRPLMKWIK